MAATLKPAGDLTPGVQVKGAVKQYQLDGINDATSGTESIGPYDSGTILGTVPPGKPGIKQISGVIQRADAALLCDATIRNCGNNLVPSYNEIGSGAPAGFDGLPAAPAGSDAEDGLSLAPQHE
jgi:hypothetical protein